MDNLKAKPIKVDGLVKYQLGAVVSREIIKTKVGTVTIFSFAKGQGLSEHSAPFDAMVQIIDGVGEITISRKKHVVKKGEFIIMPANEPHALFASKPFKMILTMIRSK